MSRKVGFNAILYNHHVLLWLQLNRNNFMLTRRSWSYWNRMLKAELSRISQARLIAAGVIDPLAKPSPLAAWRLGYGQANANGSPTAPTWFAEALRQAYVEGYAAAKAGKPSR